MISVESREQRRAFARFWDCVEVDADKFDAAVEVAALRIPAFAALLASIPAEVRAAQTLRSRAMQRAALVEGRWAEYLDSLKTQGIQYAQMGIEFRDWFKLLGAYRSSVLRHMLEKGSPLDADHVSDILDGMDRFIDISMSTIGTAYIETKEALIRRAESQVELYSDMFRGAPVGMVMYHLDAPPDPGSLRLLDANPAARLVAPAVRMENVGRTIGDFAPHLLGTEIMDHFAATIETCQPRDWVATSRGPDGHEVTYHVQCFAPKERFLGVIFEDITERRWMEERLHKNVAELERSNRDLDEFAYVASHDLKSPLQDIRSLATWIAEDIGDDMPAGSAKHLTRLRDRIGRMEQLLDDLLEYSRTGRGDTASEDVSLKEVVDDAVALLALPPGFRLDIQADMPRLQTPKAPLAQVLRNLLGNAIKHHDRPSGHITVSAAEEADKVRISVADDGPGVPPEFHERVFRMFQTLRPRDQVEGSGVGLAIVKKAVELHGGTVEIDSNGRGTTIHFTWPRRWAGKEREEP